MVWKEITNFDHNVDVFMSIQNNSLIPFSKVTIQFTTASSPVEGKGFVLTGPNQWSQRVPAGTRVFYKEEDGGICTWWSRGIEKLVNYDIPTVEETVTKLRSKSIICPEGSYVTLQNLSDEPIYYNFLGKGNFVLTQYQAVSYTFAKDSVVNLSGDGTPTLTYMIGQSPNVTMLSEATQRLLDEINAKIEGLLEHAATKEELDIVKRRTYFGLWSPFLGASGTGGKTISSPKLMKDMIYYSEFIKDNDILDMAIELQYARKDGKTTIQEKATIRATLIVQPRGDEHKFANYYCDNQWLNYNIAGLELYRDETNGQVRFDIKLKSDIVNYTIAVSLRNDMVKFIATDKSSFLNEKICTYSIDKDNHDIHFTDENFYLGILESWNYPLSVSKQKFESVTKHEVVGIGSSGLAYRSAGGLEVKFEQKDDGSQGITTITIPSSIGTNRIVGLNLKPVELSNPKAFYFDLIMMGDGPQVKTTSSSNDVYTIPMWNHTKLGFSYFFDKLAELSVEEAREYYIEVIYS